MSDDSMFIDNDLRMSCADAVELGTDYLDGALLERDHRDYEIHLTLCEGCRIYLTQLEKTVELTAASRDESRSLPSGFDDILRTFVDGTD